MRLDSSYYYKTQYGDAIETILKKYQVTEAQLMEWNPDYKNKIKNSFFKGGEKLIIKNPDKSKRSRNHHRKSKGRKM